MPLPTRITLPPSGRPVGGLLSAARPIGEARWWAGVTFASGQCLAPQNVGTCTDGDTTKDMHHLSESVAFEPFGIVQALECSTLGQSALQDFAAQALDVTKEYAVALEFLGAAATGNPSLADADLMAAASDPTAALGCIDQYASQALYGRLAFIHVPPAVAVRLAADAAIFKEGTRWLTPSGNIVVVSPGYDGRAPGDTPPAAGEPLFIYATGEVYAATGQRDELQAYERSQNTFQAIAEDAAIVVFDPCFVVAIDSGLNACDVTS